MRVMLWFPCGHFQYDFSFDPHCTLFPFCGPDPASTSANVTGHQVVFNKCPLG